MQENMVKKKIGDEVLQPLPSFDFGRIAAQTAKQVISFNVRVAERERQFNDFIDKKYFLSCPESYEDFPFGAEITIFKVKDKWFGLLTEREGSLQINLKCDPDEALILRDLFKSVVPGYHMNKKHWNTIILDGTIPEKEIEAKKSNKKGPPRRRAERLNLSGMQRKAYEKIGKHSV